MKEGFLRNSRKQQLLVILVLIGVDLATKQWAQSYFEIVANRGGVFGILSGFSWVGVQVLFMLWIVWEWYRVHEPYLQWGMAVIIAGGIGNIVDRMLYGYVRDFIYYPLVGLYGNVADIYLTLGAVYLLSAFIIKSKKEPNAD